MTTPRSPNQPNQPGQGRAQSQESMQGRENRPADQREQREGGARASGTRGERAQPVPTTREGGLARRDRPSRGLAPFGAGAWAASPFALMQQLQDEVERLFADFGVGRSQVAPLGVGRGLRAGRGAADLAPSAFLPQVDVFRRGEELVVRADLPGLSKDDVSVDIEEGVLAIRGERRQEEEQEREGVYWSERSYGVFERSVPLPEGVDEQAAKASFRDGVLEVTIPVPKERERRGRRLEIGERAGRER